MELEDLLKDLDTSELMYILNYMKCGDIFKDTECKIELGIEYDS